MSISQSSNGYSTIVQLQAHIDGRSHRLSHVGPNEIILVEPLAIHPGPVSVDVIIDNHRQTYQAEITASLPAGTTRVPVNFADHTPIRNMQKS